MIGRAAAMDANDNSIIMPNSCKRFINSPSVDLAALELAQQFKDRGQPEAICLHGTVFSLYNGVFLFADSFTPSNFTVFGFYESEPNSNEDLYQHYYVCQLINLQGEKKSDDQIKASLKQEVRVPSSFDGMGQQLIYFTTAAAEIFFGDESVGVAKLRQLTRTISQNRKQFRNNIALDEWFVPKFLFAVDNRFQRWLRSCEDAKEARYQVNDAVLDFLDIIENILNKTFVINLPTTFRKVMAKPETATAPSANPVGPNAKPEQQQGEKNKKRKKDEDNPKVKNSQQDDDFKPKADESWDATFKSKHPKDRPDWTDKIKMCARWHIKGDCFENCLRAISHVPKDQIPAEKKAAMLSFMAKCRSD